MGNDITDSSLLWKAGIDTSELKAQIAEIEALFAKSTVKFFDSNTVKQDFEQAKTIAVKANDDITQAVIKNNDRQVVDTRITEQEKTKIIQEANETRQHITDTFVPIRANQGGGPPGKPLSTAPGLSAEVEISNQLTAAIAAAKNEYKELDFTTQAYISSLTKLQVEQSQLKAAQSELNAAVKSGAVTEKEYIAASAGFNAQSREINSTLKQLTANQKLYDDALNSDNRTLDQKKLILQQLEAEYYRLGKARDQSARGSFLKEEIAGLKTSIAAVEEVGTKATSSGNAIVNAGKGAFSFIRQLAYILPGIGIAGIIGVVSDAVIGFFKAMIQGSDQTISKIELLGKASEKVADNYTKQLAAIRPFQEALRSVNLTEQTRADIYNKLVAINPEIVRGLDAQTISYAALSKGVSEYVANLKTQFRLQANSEAIQESIKNEQELTKQINFAGEQYNRAVKAGESGASAAKDFKNEIIDFANQLKKQQQITNELGVDSFRLQDKLHEKHSRNLADIDADIAAAKKAQEAVGTKAEYNAIQKSIDLLQKERDAITGVKEKHISGENQLLALLDRRRKAIEDIANLERDAVQSGLTRKASEIDNINQKYDQQLQKLKDLNIQIVRYNATHKGADVANITAAEFDRVNAARNLELLNFSYKEDAKNYIEQLKTKQAAFDQLQEAFASADTLRIEKTQKVYQKELDGFMSYVAKLQDERNKLISKVIAGTANTGDYLKIGSLTDIIKTQTPIDQAKQKAQVTKDYDELLSVVTTFNIKKAAINDKYNKLEKTLLVNQNAFTADEYKKQLALFEKGRAEDIEAAGALVLEQDDIYQKYFKNKEDFSAKATQAVIVHLEKERQKVKEGTAEYNAYTNAITEARKAAGLSADGKSNQDFVKGLRQTANTISSIFSNVSIEVNKNLKITGDQIAGIFNNLATVFDKNSTKADKNNSIIGLIFTFVSSISSVITTALQTSKDMASGLEPSVDFANKVTLAVNAQNDALERQKKLIDDLYGPDKVDGLLKLQDEIQKKQKETFEALKKLQIDSIVSQGQYYVDSLFHGTGDAFRADTTAGKIFKILNDPFGFIPKTIRVNLETVDTSSFNTIEQFINLLDEIKLNGGKINGKLVVEDDIKALQTLVDNYNDLQEKSAELKKQLQQLFTATTSDSIADGIIEGLKAGKKGAKDFADNFEDLMRNAIIQSIKTNTLEKPLSEFYDQFAKDAASNGILTDEEIAALKGNYDDIVNKAAEQFKALEQITKVDLSSSNDPNNSLSGAIKGITAQQADLLAGQFGGLRITAIEQLKVATNSMNSLQEINNNTRNTVFKMTQILEKYDAYETGGKVIWVKLKP